MCTGFREKCPSTAGKGALRTCMLIISDSRTGALLGFLAEEPEMFKPMFEQRKQTMGRRIGSLHSPCKPLPTHHAMPLAPRAGYTFCSVLRCH